MKTVYRVEHIAYRHGPYVCEGMSGRNAALSSKMCIEAKRELQPLPKYDGITKMEEELYCGFDSLDSLFEKWLTDLEEHDYHVAVFNVAAEDVIVGGKQVVFPRKKYRRASAIPMGEVKR